MTRNAFIQFSLQVGILLVSLGIAWATVCSKVNILEKHVYKAAADHDTLLIIVTKLDILQQDVKDVKHKMEDIQKKIK